MSRPVPVRVGIALRTLPHLAGPALLVAAVIAIVIATLYVVFGPPDSAGLAPVALADMPQAATLKLLLDQQISDYEATLERFDANIRLQAVFVVVTVLLIIRRSDQLTVFGNTIPLSWLHAFVPLFMIYLWLSFGFLLDALIEGRIRGIQLMAKMDGNARELGMDVFQDAGFIDGWFVAYIPEYCGIDRDFAASTSTFFIIVLGGLISAAHASLLAIVPILCRRYLREFTPHWRLASYVAMLVPLAILLMSHIQFAYGGKNQNTIELWIAAGTPLLMLVLIGMAAWVDLRGDPASVTCLRRRTGRRWRAASPTAIARKDGRAHVARARIRVALIGDSLSTEFYIGSRLAMWRRLWTHWRWSWFFRTDQGPGYDTVCERLRRWGPVSAFQHAAVSARVDSGASRGLLAAALNSWNFSHQVDELSLGRFPDLLLIWIGHNNMDWAATGRPPTSVAFAAMADEFAIDYRRQLERVIAAAEATGRKCVIVVYGLINFEAFFEARARAEHEHGRDPKRFPMLRRGYVHFESMRPDRRDGMCELARACNQRLEALCDSLRGAAARDVRLVYSPAMANASIDGCEMLSQVDAWHPNAEGHRLLAEAAFAAIEPHRTFLGHDVEVPDVSK